MHKIAIVLLSLMLIVAPVYGQAIPPTPVAPQGEIASAIRETGQVTESIGAATVIAVVLAVGSVVVTGLFIFGFFWFFIRPLLKSNTDANNQITSMSASSVQAQLLTAQTQERTALELVKVATYMSAMSTKTDDETRTNAAAEKIVDDVNTHTDEAIKPAVDSANEAVADLKKLSEQMKTLVTQKHFNDGMKDMQKQLDIIIEKMERKTDAPCPPAAESPPAEGGTVEQVDTNSKAKE